MTGGTRTQNLERLRPRIKCALYDDPVGAETSWVNENVYWVANCNWMVVCYIYTY